MTAGPASSKGYFEDFVPGEVFRHMRGKTIGEMENVLFTHLTMNTAQGHFNEHAMADTEFGRRIVFGGITASLVVGLASPETGENAVAELGIGSLRLKSPVFHGDTLYAATEVLAAEEGERADAGLVRFRHVGFNQRGEEVCELERLVLMRRREPRAAPP